MKRDDYFYEVRCYLKLNIDGYYIDMKPDTNFKYIKLYIDRKYFRTYCIKDRDIQKVNYKDYANKIINSDELQNYFKTHRPYTIQPNTGLGVSGSLNMGGRKTCRCWSRNHGEG